MNFYTFNAYNQALNMYNVYASGIHIVHENKLYLLFSELYNPF